MSRSMVVTMKSANEKHERVWKNNRVGVWEWTVHHRFCVYIHRCAGSNPRVSQGQGNKLWLVQTAESV
jgi:hypothetical protein